MKLKTPKNKMIIHFVHFSIRNATANLLSNCLLITVVLKFSSKLP